MSSEDSTHGNCSNKSAPVRRTLFQQIAACNNQAQRNNYQRPSASTTQCTVDCQQSLFRIILVWKGFPSCHFTASLCCCSLQWVSLQKQLTNLSWDMLKWNENRLHYYRGEVGTLKSSLAPNLEEVGQDGCIRHNDWRMWSFFLLLLFIASLDTNSTRQKSLLQFNFRKLTANYTGL